MNRLSEIRQRHGLSQRALATKASLSFRALQQLEHPGHNWRLSSMNRVAAALGLPRHGLEHLVDRFLSLPADSVEEVSFHIELDGFESWKTHLFNFVDAFRSTHDPRLIHHPPIPETEPRLAALMAGTVEVLCAEAARPAPDWCRGIPPLPVPWFVSGVENLKACALVEAPAQFRQRNIFVLGNFLNRA